MLVGIDFDNTIVSYDLIVHKLAVENGLVPAEVPRSKSAVRDYLRAANREDDWTELQGSIYGPGMRAASPFSGVLEFLQAARRKNVHTTIISHKTRYPYRGPCYDLHQSAREWLEERGLMDPARTGLDQSRVYLELTKEKKLERIGAAGCDWFIDDLPEFLSEPSFPEGVRRILFDPAGIYDASPDYVCMPSWSEISLFLLASGQGL